VERIWLKSYPPGVPAEIDVDEFASLGDLFAKGVAQFGDRAAYINMGKAITYAELDRLSAQFGAYLQGVLKLPRGSRVALMMPNLLQYPIAMFGALRAGYTVVNVNPLYTARELQHQLRDAGAETIVIVENFAHTLQQVLPQVPVRNIVVTSLGELLGFPKSLLVNFVVRRIKKMVPAWDLPGHIRFSEALARGSAHALAPLPWGTRTSPTCNTQAVRRAWRRARSSRMETSLPICSRRMRGSARICMPAMK
jgi:long-chain acyl-CoA synthetase